MGVDIQEVFLITLKFHVTSQEQLTRHFQATIHTMFQVEMMISHVLILIIVTRSELHTMLIKEIQGYGDVTFWPYNKFMYVLQCRCEMGRIKTKYVQIKNFIFSCSHNKP